MFGTFEDEPFEITIKDGNAHLTWGEAPPRIIPLRIMRIEHDRVSRALALHDQRCAEVVPLKPRRKRAG